MDDIDDDDGIQTIKQQAMLMQQQQAMAEQQPKPLDPNMVMLADIEQRREASILKNEEAKMKTETEAFKSQLNFLFYYKSKVILSLSKGDGCFNQ